MAFLVEYHQSREQRSYQNCDVTSNSVPVYRNTTQSTCSTVGSVEYYVNYECVGVEDYVEPIDQNLWRTSENVAKIKDRVKPVWRKSVRMIAPIHFRSYRPQVCRGK